MPIKPAAGTGESTTGDPPMATETTTRLNDVDIGRVVSLTDRVRTQPAAASTTWAANVKWRGGFRSEAKVRDFSPAASDEPEILGGTDTGPNPVEQLLGALGNCLAVGYAANATAAGVEIRDLSIRVKGDLDLRTFLGLADGHAGFSDITVEVQLDTDAAPEAVEALHDQVVSSSPVGHTLTRDIPVDISLT